MFSRVLMIMSCSKVTVIFRMCHFIQQQAEKQQSPVDRRRLLRVVQDYYYQKMCNRKRTHFSLVIIVLLYKDYNDTAPGKEIQTIDVKSWTRCLKGKNWHLEQRISFDLFLYAMLFNCVNVTTWGFCKVCFFQRSMKKSVHITWIALNSQPEKVLQFTRIEFALKYLHFLTLFNITHVNLNVVLIWWNSLAPKTVVLKRFFKTI